MSDLDAYRRASPRARLGVGAAIVLVLVALAATVGIGIWRSAAAPAHPVPREPIVTDTPALAAVTGELYIHVSGAVERPGLYVVAADARVIDAVSAAGGLTDDAAGEGVNLARPVTDGEQLVVPREGEEPSVPGPDASPLIDLNTADAATLESLTGIGPALASRIIDWRETEGPFGSVEDLLAVSGIGPSVLESVREQVTV